MSRIPGMSPMDLYNLIQRSTFTSATKSHNATNPLCVVDIRQLHAFNDGHILRAYFMGPNPDGTVPDAPDITNADVVVYGDRESNVRLSEVAQQLLRLGEANSVKTLVAFYEEFAGSYPFMIATTEEDLDAEEAGTNHRIPIFPSEVVARRVYLSDGPQAMNERIVNDLQVTHIVNATPNLENKFEKQGIKYFRVPVQDSSVAEIHEHFEKTYKFMKKALETSNKNKVLVHCSQGISRSATLVIYYLMREKKLPMEEAKKVVVDARPWIWPNEGFIRQLQTAEKAIKDGTIKKKGSSGKGCTIS